MFYNETIEKEGVVTMKKLLALFISLLLMLNLVACGAPAEPEGWYSEDGITITQEKTQQILNSEFTAPKNIILIIGDGMGPNDITLAERYVDGVYEFGTVLNQIPNHGLVTTHSANQEITDSAAAGTALSTGVKTNNGYLGKDVEGNDLKNMAERAREAGKKVGIITDEDLSGATPTSFVIHNISRDNTAELVNAMVEFGPEVMMCRDYDEVDICLSEENREVVARDYIVAKKFRNFIDVLDTDPDCEKKFFGNLNGYGTTPSDNLAQCAQVAMKRLENENGFFLMIESAGTDKYGHGGAFNGKLSSVVTLDRTVAAVLLFMEKNPDTLLIITSDHETGGIRIPEEGENMYTAVTTEEHTATPVRVFAVGQGAEYFKDKTLDNTDIAKFMIAAIEG